MENTKVGGLGLSPTATRQAERMISDMAFITYPAHVMIDGLRMALYACAFVLLLVFGFVLWLFTAKAERTDLTKDFGKRVDIVTVKFNQFAPTVTPTDVSFSPFDIKINHLNTTDAYLVTDNLIADRKIELAKFFSYCDGGMMKRTTWTDGVPNWLGQKSNTMLAAYLTGAQSTDALRLTLASIKAGETVPMTQACGATVGDRAFKGAYPLIVIPNAPQVVMTRVAKTNYEEKTPADFRGNWMTGICIYHECTNADMVPRNTSIFYDVVKAQMTAGQQKAIDALNATATTEYWLAAAHANGIFGHDEVIKNMAEINRQNVAQATAVHLSQDAKNMRTLQLIFAGAMIFVAFMFVTGCRRAYKDWRHGYKGI